MTTTSRDTIRRRILDGETLFGAWTDMASPLATEITGRAGYDWLVVDLEHGAGTEASLLSVLLAAEASGAAAFVRPQSAERLRIGRALDLGAAGIVVPRLDTAAQAAEAVSFLRYPPGGVRGVALRTRGARLGTVGHAEVGSLNAGLVGIVQIESPSALREADDIAAIEGVDVLFVGPADLSHSLGIPGQFANPTYLAALDAVVGACRRHGKSPGILLYDHASFGPHLARGFRFVGVGSEGSFIAEGAAAALAAARAGRPSS
ncbi:MAG TPA: aldolase/citrate lyase family protein [Candidatus Sulfomarinibacteraceae bacterium]|nr:aldolase/citrate lyase family protein [Candidatus Sulfomarinibacteraceae bacterium]